MSKFLPTEHPEGAGSHIALTALFKQIWLLSDKKSFVSGLFLRKYMGTALEYNCFAHVLAKGQNQYPYFKYYAKNIVLLSPGEHGLLDQGTEEARISYALDVKSANWQPLYDLREELKKEYKKHFPSTRGIIIGYKYSPEEVVAKVGLLNKKYFESMIKAKKKGR
jgi:hypothetical protein